MTLICTVYDYCVSNFGNILALFKVPRYVHSQTSSRYKGKLNQNTGLHLFVNVIRLRPSHADRNSQATLVFTTLMSMTVQGCVLQISIPDRFLPSTKTLTLASPLISQLLCTQDLDSWVLLVARNVCFTLKAYLISESAKQTVDGSHCFTLRRRIQYVSIWQTTWSREADVRCLSARSHARSRQVRIAIQMILAQF
jgi:hypothetical protein